MKQVLAGLLILFTSTTHANPNYQVDLILFAQPGAFSTISGLQNSPLIPISEQAIKLGSSSGSYQLLKPSQSDLRDEYYALNRLSKFQVLAQYSWRQPAASKATVALPDFVNKGWQMQGTMQIRQSTYYVLDAELQFAPDNNPDAAFTVSQKQRLKDNQVYYFDHPEIGMIVKIHKLEPKKS